MPTAPLPFRSSVVICAICGLVALGATDGQSVEDDADLTGNAEAPWMGKAVTVIRPERSPPPCGRRSLSRTHGAGTSRAMTGSEVAADRLPIAVSVMPLGTGREAILYLSQKADALGYEALFLPETWSYDVMVLLAEVAVRTKHIGLGTGLVGPWGRSAATIAMASATLHEISGGRFILGLGASTPQLAEGLHDTPYVDPTATLRRVIQQVRALLAGERIPLSIDTTARPLRLDLRVRPDAPIYLGALASASVRLAGELCDGWMPFLIPRDRLGEGISRVREGAVGSTPPRRTPRICPLIPAVVAEDSAAAREGAAWFLAFYLIMMGTVYRKGLSRQGFAKEVEAILEANRGRSPSAVPAEAEGLLRQVTVFGTATEVREQLARWYDAGADLPILMFRPNPAREEIDRALEAFRGLREHSEPC